MKEINRRLDRRLRIAAAVFVASAALLAVGLFALITTVGKGADLPDQGDIEEIVRGNPDLRYQDLATTEPSLPPVPAPVRMLIERIHVDAPIVQLGLDPQALPQIPDAPDEIAFYDFSPRPGQGSNAVFSGHVDWSWRGRPVPAVFYQLKDLDQGDTIKIIREDGSDLLYKVTANVAVRYDDPNVVKVMDRTQKDVITLITCGGSWLRDYRAVYGGNYSHRVIVRAERVIAAAASGAATGTGDN